MEELSKLYNIKFRFYLTIPYLNGETGNKVEKVAKWLKFKRISEGRYENAKLMDVTIEQWLCNCKLESNRNLPLLDRVERGIGGDDSTDKQIRFRFLYRSMVEKDHDIIMNVTPSVGKLNWTLAQLDDLVYGFIKTMSDYIETGAVDGCIQLTNETIGCSDYLDE